MAAPTINPEDIKKAIIKAIEKNMYISSFTEAITHAGVDNKTFAKYFPKDSEQRSELYQLLLQNRAKVKLELKKKWGKNKNAITEIALYKLMATDSEAHRLNGTKTENTSKITIEQPLFGDDENE